MTRSLAGLIVLISLAHALVHTYELAWPSIEQEAAATLLPDQPSEAKQLSGWLSGTWRLLFGVGSLVVGLLVTRRSALVWLVAFLWGCAVTSVWAGRSGGIGELAAALAAMGGFAAIYHPAGLTLISLETTPEVRPRALGLHGILGSLGIALAPFVAAVWLSTGGTWRGYLTILAIPGVIVGAALLRFRPHASDREATPRGEDNSDPAWSVVLLLGTIAAVQGFVYAAQLSFLPRYLSGVDSASLAWLFPPWLAGISMNVAGKYLAAGALLVGCLGQFVSGRFARHRWLESQLTGVLLVNVPFLMAMGLAEGAGRVAAAGGFALVHFMYQPVYNSLIAKRIGAQRRGVAFGVSFAVSLGLGSLGAVFASRFQQDEGLYFSLAGVTGLGILAAGALAWIPGLRSQPVDRSPETIR